MKNIELIQRLQLLNPLSDVYFDIKDGEYGSKWMPIDIVEKKEFGNDRTILLKKEN